MNPPYVAMPSSLSSLRNKILITKSPEIFMIPLNSACNLLDFNSRYWPD
jgi:hypothetical protein